MSEMFQSGLAGSLTTTMLVSAFALLATWVPFVRGLRIFFKGLAATRKVEAAELRRSDALAAGEAPLAMLLVQVLRKSHRESSGDHPTEFLIDASRQYVMNEYDAHYAQRIGMYANILPPIGFIGTTSGLFILFLSMRVSSDSLELGALALALTSSIFALVAFAILEGLKIMLYGRLLASVSHVLTLQRSAAQQRQRVATAAS